MDSGIKVVEFKCHDCVQVGPETFKRLKDTDTVFGYGDKELPLYESEFQPEWVGSVIIDNKPAGTYDLKAWMTET